MPVEIEYLSPKAVELARDQLRDVFSAAFTPPPYAKRPSDAATFAEDTFPRHMRYAGFRCCAARRSGRDSIVGFAYGYTGAPGQWWYDVVANVLDPEVAKAWLPGHFEVVELAVAPSAQGEGVGGRLHDALLAGLPHPTAMLSTLQAQTRGQRLYRKRGWQPLLEDFTFPGGRVPYMIMGRNLGKIHSVR